MDIRQILNALSPDDRALWSECRTQMRRAFLVAHNNTVGIDSWRDKDDAMMDLIDIKLAELFDDCGKLEASEDIIHKDDSDKIIDKIVENGDKISAATKSLLANKW